MSRTPEAEVKDYLRDRIKALGGELRFVKWLGRNHAPDCYVMFPDGKVRLGHVPYHGYNCWVETKAPGKRPRPGQEREHKRMRAMGEIVLVLPTKEDIDREFPL